MPTIVVLILALILSVTSGASPADPEPTLQADAPAGLVEHLAEIAEIVAANVEAAAERAAAAEVHAEAIMDWTACVATNAAGRADVKPPKPEPFDPKDGCGAKPTPPDGIVEDDEETEGPPEGTPQGPPEGTPQGPPEGTPQGPPEGTQQGPPEGTPQGPPEGTPQGPPTGRPSDEG